MNSEKEGRGRGPSHCGRLALTPRRGSSFTISEWSEREGGGLIHLASGE